MHQLTWKKGKLLRYYPVINENCALSNFGDTDAAFAVLDLSPGAWSASVPNHETEGRCVFHQIIYLIHKNKLVEFIVIILSYFTAWNY